MIVFEAAKTYACELEKQKIMKTQFIPDVTTIQQNWGTRTGGQPIPKTLIRGIEFQSDQRQEKERAATFGSTTDSGSSTSENLAPST